AKARARAADLAHGQRTPLQALEGADARLRARGDDPLADDVAAVVSAMSRHVERELARARLAGRSAAARAALRPIAERVVAVVRRTPDGMARSFDVAIPETLAARIDPDDLTEALGNLVENAARHARAVVRLAAERETGRVRVRVSDDGPGIPQDALDAVLVRGGRLDARGSGAGLGLAIVQEIADAWGGTLSCETGPEGFRATLDLPVAG
ncbi:sensor histidine kinase, partial [Salinarimonas sp. NSM]|uniref:sensor histidine kinase n=1 Tax=Salinarimonas sp. NSM TaxID=3458003 RepID=UPI004036A97D